MKNVAKNILGVCLLIPACLLAQSDSDRIPAAYLFAVGGTNSEHSLLRPEQIRFDGRHDEFYIADTGNDRIVILDNNGQPIFSFQVSPVLHAPIDMAVDTDGRIYVAGSSNNNKSIQVFDYNGRYLRPFEFHGAPNPPLSGIKNIVIDSEDRLYLLDEDRMKVLSFSTSGEFLSEFDILEQLDKKTRDEEVLGNMSVCDDVICIPASSVGAIYCYSKTGSFMKMIGNKGGAYGELSFPVAVSRGSCQEHFCP